MPSRANRGGIPRAAAGMSKGAGVGSAEPQAVGGPMAGEEGTAKSGVVAARVSARVRERFSDGSYQP